MADVVFVVRGYWDVNVEATFFVLAGDVTLMLCDFECLTGYSNMELDFSGF
jgi:hypothetical protein